MKKFGNTRFEYDANGLRRKKGNKEYVWSGDRLLYEKEDGEITTRYFYDASGIAGYNYRGGEFKFRKNLQGDIIGIIDNTGTLLGTYEYDAWGNCTATKVIISGTSLVLSMNPFRYRGYYFDSETGLYYLQSRYYDPKTGRFISPDAYSYLEPDTVNGLNLYSYCNNNPVMNVDPDGHLVLSIGAIIFAGAMGALFGAVARTYGVVKNGGSAREAAGAFVGGAITGFFSGIAMALGGGMALAGASAVALMGGTVGMMGIGFGVGIGAYYAETGIARTKSNFSDAMRQGAKTAIDLGGGFVIGAAFGLFGGYNSLKLGNGVKDSISNSISIYNSVGLNAGLTAIGRGMVSYLYVNCTYMLLRSFFKNLFMRLFNI